LNMFYIKLICHLYFLTVFFSNLFQFF